MACYKNKCFICKESIKANGYLALTFNNGFHEEKKHPLIFKRNNEAVQKKIASEHVALNIYLKEYKQIFSESEWDTEEKVQENPQCPKCGGIVTT